MITVILLMTIFIISIEFQTLHSALEYEYPGTSILAESPDGKKEVISLLKGFSVFGHQSLSDLPEGWVCGCLREKEAAEECSQTANNIPSLHYHHSDQETAVECSKLNTDTD